MKHFLLLFIFYCFYFLPVNAQSAIDSLKHIFNQTDNDTVKLSFAGKIAEYYLEIQNDSAEQFARFENELARKLNLKLNESFSLAKMGYVLMNKGNYPDALEKLLAAITIAEDPASSKTLLPVKYLYGEDMHQENSPPESRRKGMLSLIYQYVGILYGNATDYEKEKTYQLIARNLATEAGSEMSQLLADIPLGRAYLYLKMPDSALFYLKEGYEMTEKTGYQKYQGSLLLNMARAHLLLKENEKARELFLRAHKVSKEQDYLRGMVASDLELADFYSIEGQTDSAYFYIQQALEISNALNNPSLQLRSYVSAANYYRKKGTTDSIVIYQNKIMKINDSLFGVKQAQLFQNIDFEEQKKQQIRVAEEQAQRNRIRIYSLVAGLTLLVCLALILFRNNRNKEKAYALLEKQKQETDFQRQKAEQALGELKSAQKQLIYAEKMASLGEMSSGIAHEIQNPLNFINNFSEVNKELTDDLETEIRNANKEACLQISADIRQNMDKINVHGKRADAIVKSMLEHSHSSAALKEPTDINLLADEYLRLSYHSFQSGRRTSDPVKSGTSSFAINIKTDLDARIGKMNIVPQDFSRVLVNIFNNAFYAVAEKSKKNPDYMPEVSLITKASDGHVNITVKDNGNGIPQKTIDKIFQPFFTTKPTGQGTGLGLSLAYDIVKAHGGDIKVNSVEGQGAELIVSLPPSY